MLATRPDIKDFSLENGYAVTKDFLQKKIECTAIYAISDIMAIGAGKALAEEGKPEGTLVVADMQTTGRGRRGSKLGYLFKK